MKVIKILFLTTAIIGIGLLWTSCQKEVSTTPIESQKNVSNEKSFGVAPDDPLLVSKVHMIVSSDYLANSQNLESRGPNLNLKGGKPDATKPTISISSPINGASVSGSVNVLVSASDNVGVKSVSLSIDGIVVGSSTTSPFTNTWNSGTVGNGSHTLAVIAADAAGNKGTASIAIFVNNVSAGDIISPNVSITSPANGSAFDPNIAISVNVSGSDNVGVTLVSLSVDGTVVGSSNSSSGSFSWNTGTVASGVHTLTAKAFDAAGNQGSAAISVTVNTTVINPPPGLPSSVLLDMPPVQYQGSESGCVPMALLYARDAEQYYKTGASSYSTSTNIFSPEFLYNQTKASSSCSSGASLIDELNFLARAGVCTWNSMPYSDQNGCATLPTSQQTAEAANYKIKSYSMVVAQDPTAIKTMLYNKHPLSFTFTVDANFYNAGPGYIWSSYSSTFYGPHAITLVGYDDSKHAYRAINQWGTAWGDGGYIWIDYTFFATIAYDLYAQNL